MTIATQFFNTIKNKAVGMSKKAMAQFMLKHNCSIGEAVVDILGATGIAGFKFHVPETESVKFQNEITDHYIETGTAIQDHVIQRPITITLSGLVGDYFYSVNQIEDLIAKIPVAISVVKELMPQISKVVQIKKIKWNKAPKVDKTQLPVIQVAGGPRVPLQGSVTKAKKLEIDYEFNFNVFDLFALFQSLYKLKSAQTRAFYFFEALWKSRSTFSVETTWRRYDNMVVESIEARRDRNADITELTITCKQLSFANTLTETVEQYKNRMLNQRADEVVKGLEKGSPVSISLNTEVEEAIA